MTVCIAALFKYNYGTATAPDWGPAALALSDRMITLHDVEYEPNQQKVWFINQHVILLIAGDFTAHTAAAKATLAQIGKIPSPTAQQIASIYGLEIQAISRKQAEDVILAPIGLNTDSFIAQQKEMSDHLAASLTAQLQDFQGPDVAAIVVGIHNDMGHLYEIDYRGTVRCYDDVGFAAIGIGASHAKLVLMQSGYINQAALAEALATTYAAKKAAEMAPGVGSNVTDIQVILKDGWRRLMPELEGKLQGIYSDFKTRRTALALEAIKQVQEYLDGQTTPPPAPKNQAGDNGTVVPAGDGNAPGSGDTKGPENAPETAK